MTVDVKAAIGSNLYFDGGSGDFITLHVLDNPRRRWPIRSKGLGPFSTL